MAESSDPQIIAMQAEIDRLIEALTQIAHGHDWQAAALAIRPQDPSFVLGAAQGIARRALGIEQNEWTREPMERTVLAVEKARSKPPS